MEKPVDKQKIFLRPILKPKDISKETSVAIRNVFFFIDFIKNNWKVTGFAIIIVIFILFQVFSSAGEITELSGNLETKNSIIETLQVDIDELKENLLLMNGALLAEQKARRNQYASFQSKLSKIKLEAQNQTPEQLVETFKNTWPGGEKK